MVWFAIRTHPGAQMPQREYAVETTRSVKGYRIVPSLNATVSAIERALTDAGFAHYMPAEYKVVRNRKKTRAYELRRFSLLSSYLFVSDPDLFRIRDVPGVAGVVSIGGVPAPISVVDIMALRSIEARSEAVAQQELDKVVRNDEREARKARDKSIAKARKVFSASRPVKILYGSNAGKMGSFLGWQDHETVRIILDGLKDAEAIALPLDFVRAA